MRKATGDAVARPRSTAPRSIRRAGFLKTAGLIAAASLSFAAPANAVFSITLNFDANVTPEERVSFTSAKDYWEGIISDYADPVNGLNGITIDVSTPEIDGRFGTLGRAGPDAVRISDGGIIYTERGTMEFDHADNILSIQTGLFPGVIRHEMGHVLGIGALWRANNLVLPDNDMILNNELVYTGRNAVNAWRVEFLDNNPFTNVFFDAIAANVGFRDFVPLEDEGGPGTLGGHWDEVANGAGPTGFVSRFTGVDFQFDLMTGWANAPLFTSGVNIGTLLDLGYELKPETARTLDAVPLATRRRTELAPGVTGAFYYDNNYLNSNINSDTGVGGTFVWGTVSGNNALVLDNLRPASAIALMRDNDYTGGTFIFSGKLIVAARRGLGSGPVLIDGGVLETNFTDVAVDAPLTLKSGELIGAGSEVDAPLFNLMSGRVTASLAGDGMVVKTTAGTVSLESDRSLYSGGTFVQAGTLAIGALLPERPAQAQPGVYLGFGPITVSGGATIDFRDSLLFTPGLFTLESGSLIGNPLAELEINNDLVLMEGLVSVRISGVGILRKSGPGTVALTKDNNLIFVDTLISEGKLSAQSVDALTGPVAIDGGTLGVDAPLVRLLDGLTLDSGSITGAGTLDAAFYSVSGGLISANLSGVGFLSKDSLGELILSGSNSFTGGVNLLGGTIRAAGAQSLSTGLVSLDAAGTLVIEHSLAAVASTLQINAGGGTLSFSTLTDATVGSLAGDGVLVLANANGAPLALSLGSNGVNTAYSGVISGGGSLIKVGASEQTLSGANTFTGGVTVSAGKLIITTAESLGVGALTMTGGTLDIGANAIAPSVFTQIAGVIAGAGTINAARFNIQGGAIATGLVGAGTLEKTGAGSATLSGANTYAGGTTISGGRLTVQNLTALGTGAVVISGAELNLAANLNTSSVSLVSGAITGVDHTLTATSDFDFREGVSAVRLAGNVALKKTTSGTLILNGASVFTGGINIEGGRIVALSSGTLTSGPISVAPGTALQVGAGASFSPALIGGTVTNNGSIEFDLASDLLVSRVITGSGTIVQNGTGLVKVVNGRHTGVNIANSGALSFSEAALPSGTFIANGVGAIDFTSSGGVTDFTRNVEGSGGISFSGAGTTRLHGAYSQTGAFMIAPGKTVSLGSSSVETPVSLQSSLLMISQGATLRGSGNVRGSLANAGTLSPGFSPGTITLGGDFTNTGTLIMEIGGAGEAHDQINYAGTAFLGGKLIVTSLGNAPSLSVVPLFVDTNTGDGRPSVSGVFASSLFSIPGILYNTGSGLSLQVDGTLATIPGLNLPPSLLPYAQSLYLAGLENTVIGAAISPVSLPVPLLAAQIIRSSPVGYASAAALVATESTRDSDQIRRHLDSRRYERFDAHETGWSPYIDANGVTVSSGGNIAEDPNFNYNIFGGLAGADHRVNEKLTIGGNIGYDHGTATFRDGAGDLSQDHLRLTGYFSQLVDRTAYVDAGFFVGGSTYDVKHNNALGSSGADTTGWDAGIFLGTGMVLPVTKGLQLTPHLGMTWTHVDVGGFTEEGNVLALRIKNTEYDSFALRFGSGLNWQVVLADMPVRFGFDISYVRELGKTKIDVHSDFVNATTGLAATSANIVPQDRLEVGPEVDWQVAQGQSVTASYRLDYAFGSLTGNRFDIGYRIRF